MAAPEPTGDPLLDLLQPRSRRRPNSALPLVHLGFTHLARAGITSGCTAALAFPASATYPVSVFTPEAQGAEHDDDPDSDARSALSTPMILQRRRSDAVRRWPQYTAVRPTRSSPGVRPLWCRTSVTMARSVARSVEQRGLSRVGSTHRQTSILPRLLRRPVEQRRDLVR